jgi:hypothetical protein
MFIRSWVGICVCAFGLAQAQPPRTTSSVYFLRDNAEQRWCGFASKLEWSSHSQKADVNVMGYIDYAENRMTQINVRMLSVSGDWALEDKYVMDLNQDQRRNL